MLYVLLGILAGNSLPVQTSVNACLRKQVDHPLLASMVSFLVTICTFLTALLLSEGRIWLPLDRMAKEPFWIWLPGFFGIFFLTGNILLFSKLGGIRTVILTATGQVLTGLMVDHFGLFGTASRPATLFRGAGAVLALVGVTVVSLAKRSREEKRAVRSVDLPWSLFGIFIGVCSAVQTAINSRVGGILDNAMKATLLSAMESVPLLLLLTLLLSKKLPLRFSGFRHTRWWMYLGGVAGAVYIFFNAWLSARLGTGLAVIALLIGSTGGGLVIDQFGWFGAPRQRISLMKLFGVALMLAGAMLIRLL